MNPVLTATLTLGATCLCSAALCADMIISAEQGALTLRTTSTRLAAWQMEPGKMVVATPEGGRLRVGKLPDTWIIHAADIEDGLGVVINGPAAPWQAVRQGPEWIITTAKAPMKGNRPLAVKGVWAATSFTLKGRTVPLADVTTRDTGTWKVAFVSTPLAAKGALIGAATPALNVIEPASGPEKQVETHSATAKATHGTTPEAPMALTGLGQTLARGTGHTAPAAARVGLGEMPVLKDASRTGLVPMHAAASLAAVPSPHAKAEDAKGTSFAQSLVNDVYIPGTIITLTVPEGLRTDLLPPAAPATPAEPEEHEEPTEHQPEPEIEHTSVSAHAGKDDVHGDTHAASAVPVSETVVRGPMMFPDTHDRYVDDLADLLQATAETPDNSRRQAVARTNLAMFYLARERPEEALGVLDAFPKRADGLPQDDLIRLLDGIALLANGRPAASEMFDQKGPLAPHAALWRAVALAQAERYTDALKAWPTKRGILPVYPSYLRELVQERQIATLVKAGDKDIARQTVDALVAGYPEDEEVPLALIRWQGIARMGTKDEEEGMRLIAKAAQDMRDPVTTYRAKYDFITLLMNKGLLSNEQALRYLTNLWMDWRGDTLERDTMKMLADIYDREDKPREALTLWQTLVKAFPTMPDMDTIARRMSSTFLRAFDPENPRVYDALTYMGLYYDFRELVPNNIDGDAVQEQMATLLNRTMLYSRSVPILEQQLNLRPLDPAAQGRLVLLLAEAYLNLGRGGDALQLLDNWEKVATTTTLKEQWKIAETHILTALNRPRAATQPLQNSATPKTDMEARDALLEATWAAGDYSSSVPLLILQLSGLKAGDIVSDTAAQLALFRLGFAYSQLHDGAKLDNLNKQYAEALSKVPAISDGLGAIAASSSLSSTVPTGGPLAPVSTALNDLNTLTANLKITRADVKEHNDSIKEFDKKMRYMELLPPPAI